MKIKEAQFGVVKIDFENNKVPEFVEHKGKDWIYYGEENDYPQFLIKLYRRSAKHNAIINSKANYIFGKGIEGEEAFLKHINKNESVNDLLKKLVLDLEIFNGFCVEVHWAMNGKDIAEMYHVDFTNIRSNKDNSVFYHSEKWVDEEGRSVYNPKDVTIIPAFNASKRSGKQLYYFTQYSPTIRTYTIPEYIGSIPYIETDFEIANFHRANIQNGFVASKMINFTNGVPDIVEQGKIERKIKQKFSGTDAAGRFIVTFNDDKDRVPEIVDIQASNMDKQFVLLNKQVQDEIFVGHRVISPYLFGVRPEDTGFSQTEYNESFIIFSSTYVRPKQNELEKVFNYLLGFNGYAIRITPIDPPSYNFSEATLLQIASKDELRKMAGLPEVTVSKSLVRDALDTLSPLVANKVLSSMSQEEIRKLIGLKGTVEVVQETPAQFEKQDELLILFDSVGVSKNAYELIKHKQFHFDNDTQLNQIEKELMFDSLSDNVLALLKDTDSTITDIAKTLGISEKEITAVIKKLETKGEIKVSKGIVSTTPKGTKIAENKPAFPEMSVRYSYELEPFAPPLNPGGTSRPFCEKLTTMDKLYTREEIDRISGIVGYSVWLVRGGWYHNPEKDVNTPYCRHIWQAGVYIKK